VLHDSGYQPVKHGTTAFGAIFVGDLQAIIHHAPAEDVFIDDDVLFLSAPVNNFGHWLIDFLPRLKGLQDLRLKVALPADLPARYGETLARFGVADADLIRCEDGKRYRFKTATLYRPGQSMPPNPHHVRFVREGLVGGKALAPKRGKRVYLSRASVGTRAVANADEFNAFLLREGFITADLADLSLADQEHLLGDADVLLGTFGSNLLGLYFAAPGCTVIAMMHDVTEDPTIAPTCAMLGMKQQYLVCEKAATSGLQRHRKDADVIVDCTLLASRLPPR
jgi:capsular polysaccharide biosynthesis protein